MSGLSKPKGTGGDEGRKGNETWVGVSGGVFTLPAEKGAPGAVQVMKGKNHDEPATDKDGNHKYRTEHENLEGRITSFSERKAQLYDGEETVFLSVHLTAADGTKYRVDLPEFKRHWENFLMRSPGIDFTKDVKLSPYSFEATNKETGKTSLKQGIAIYDGLPEATQAKNPKTGKMEWTFLERNEFLRDVVLAQAKERLIAAGGTAPVTAEVAEGVRNVPGSGIGEEDEAF